MTMHKRIKKDEDYHKRMWNIGHGRVGKGEGTDAGVYRGRENMKDLNTSANLCQSLIQYIIEVVFSFHTHTHTHTHKYREPYNPQYLFTHTILDILYTQTHIIAMMLRSVFTRWMDRTKFA